MSRAVDTVIGLQEAGKLDGIGPNVMVVRLMGVRLVEGRIPASVRRELLDAVKAGQLGRVKKEGLRPEAFFHPNAKATALDMRSERFRQAAEAIAGVVGGDPADPLSAE